MSSQRATPTLGSSRAAPSSPARSPSGARSLGTPPRETARGAASVSGSIATGMGRAAAHTTSSAARAAQHDVEATPELIAQLQERLHQLEAESKASQDTAQWTIKQNKNTLLALKQENKDLSAEVARRGGSTELQGKQGTATDGERVVERLERQVHEMRRAYDKAVKDKKTALQKLDNLHDSLKDMAKVAAAAPGAAAAASVSAVPLSASLTSAPSVSAIAASAAAAAAAASLPANSPAARELRQLQNRLEKATVKANEAFSIRKTYEQVLEKLRVEEPLLESRIRALEEQKAMKRAALQAAALSGREVQAAKEAAKATLAALEEEVAANRERRARVLEEMREKAATLQETNRALMQRQFVPLTAPTPEPSDGSAAGAGAGEQRPPAAAAAASGVGGESSGAATTAAARERDDITARDLVIRLCRTTGAKRVSELVARLLAQQESYSNLVEMRSQATAQRLALVQEVEVLRQHRDELRGCGKMTTQKQMDAAQEELRDAVARADSAAEALEALFRNHADVRGGLEHLAAMVAPLPLPPGGPPPVPLDDETMGDVLAQIEQRLGGAYKVIAALPKAVDMLESMYASLRE